MARSATNEIEGVGGDDYCRVYVPTRISQDSTFPFSPGDGIRLELVTTSNDREVLVVTSDALEVDPETTNLALRRSSREVQMSMQEVGEE